MPKVKKWKKGPTKKPTFSPLPIQPFGTHRKKTVLGWSTYPNTEMLGHPVTVSHQVPDSCGVFVKDYILRLI